MTLPDERYRAIVWTREFLRDLLDPKKTPKVPKGIRRQAYACLKHYPGTSDLDVLAALSKGKVISKEP